jgi:hypothetical protein
VELLFSVWCDQVDHEQASEQIRSKDLGVEPSHNSPPFLLPRPKPPVYANEPILKKPRFSVLFKRSPGSAHYSREARHSQYYNCKKLTRDCLVSQCGPPAAGLLGHRHGLTVGDDGQYVSASTEINETGSCRDQTETCSFAKW